MLLKMWGCEVSCVMATWDIPSQPSTNDGTEYQKMTKTQQFHFFPSVWLSASNLYFIIFFCCMCSFLHFHFLNYFWLRLLSFTLIFMLYNYYCLYGCCYCWCCYYYTLFLFQIRRDVGEQVLFDFCAEGFILLIPTQQLAVRCLLVLIL